MFTVIVERLERFSRKRLRPSSFSMSVLTPAICRWTSIASETLSACFMISKNWDSSARCVLMRASRSMKSSVTSWPVTFSAGRLPASCLIWSSAGPNFSEGIRTTSLMSSVRFEGSTFSRCFASEVTTKPPFASAIDVTRCCASVVESTSRVKSALRMILRSAAALVNSVLSALRSETFWVEESK